MTDRSHYRKTSPTTTIDVYRIILLYKITDPCLQHALKKIVAAGQRGGKSAHQDIAEAIESLRRWQEMRIEEAQAAVESAPPATPAAHESVYTWIPSSFNPVRFSRSTF